MFYMFADKKGIAYLEITPNGTFATKSLVANSQTTDLRNLTHANQYKIQTLINKMQDEQQIILKDYPSSTRRQQTIDTLIGQSPFNFSIEDFKTFGNHQEQSFRANDRLCRTQNNDSQELTMATFIVKLDPEANDSSGISIYSKINNAGKVNASSPSVEYPTTSYDNWSETSFSPISSFCFD